YINANQLGSPIQFGQGTRLEVYNGVPILITGVTRPHLADDIFIEYTRKMNANTYLTAGFSVSFPGAGIASIVPSKTPAWSGGFVNV
ncbi:hypothetical protein, partial [Klebsiella aerogenes]|uniref:hypothetical protein n=1 Tax=Klebsiella aerogenes TaxID=548 RepID=UPI0019538E09